MTTYVSPAGPEVESEAEMLVEADDAYEDEEPLHPWEYTEGVFRRETEVLGTRGDMVYRRVLWLNGDTVAVLSSSVPGSGSRRFSITEVDVPTGEIVRRASVGSDILMMDGHAQLMMDFLKRDDGNFMVVSRPGGRVRIQILNSTYEVIEEREILEQTGTSRFVFNESATQAVYWFWNHDEQRRELRILDLETEEVRVAYHYYRDEDSETFPALGSLVLNETAVLYSNVWSDFRDMRWSYGGGMICLETGKRTVFDIEDFRIWSVNSSHSLALIDRFVGFHEQAILDLRTGEFEVFGVWGLLEENGIYFDFEVDDRYRDRDRIALTENHPYIIIAARSDHYSALYFYNFETGELRLAGEANSHITPWPDLVWFENAISPSGRNAVVLDRPSNAARDRHTVIHSFTFNPPL